MQPERLSTLNFDYLFEQYKKRIYIYVFKIVKSSFIAEEITQEIFIKLWLFSDRLSEINNLDGFVFKIVRNHTLNHLRKVAYDDRLLKEILAFTAREQNNIDEKITATDYQLLVQKALDCLSPQRRLVYELSRKKGLNHEEIANQLDLSKNTVKNHIGSALKHIQNYLSKNGISVAILLLLLK